jgi:Na+-driven multidrug efflux pump
LIPIYGIVGAAVASWIAQIAGWSFLLFCFYHYFRGGSFPFAQRGAGPDSTSSA